MSRPDFLEQIDEAAEELLADDSQSYEAGIWIASAADDYVDDATWGQAASLIRDTFGTWVELIHTHGHANGSTVAQVEAAHGGIENAVNDWTNGGRGDPVAFGERWRATLERVDTKWLDEPAHPLTTSD